MQERIVEILLYLVNELRSNKRLSDVDVSSLTRDGYTQSEISSAFSWLFERLTLGKSITDVSSGASTSYRMLNDIEKMVIESQAFGYLIQCRQLGLLSTLDIETIIERIMMAGFSTVGLPEMKSFVAGYLFDLEGSNGQVSLGMNDTIH
jgi:Smg protein